MVRGWLGCRKTCCCLVREWLGAIWPARDMLGMGGAPPGAMRGDAWAKLGSCSVLLYARQLRQRRRPRQLRLRRRLMLPPSLVLPRRCYRRRRCYCRRFPDFSVRTAHAIRASRSAHAIRARAAAGKTLARSRPARCRPRPSRLPVLGSEPDGRAMFLSAGGPFPSGPGRAHRGHRPCRCHRPCPCHCPCPCPCPCQ